MTMISIILCTYNRCRDLLRAVDTISKCVIPAACQWELLIVDNNSDDGTREAVADFCRSNPHRIRYLFEPRQGKGFALNRGVRAAHGDTLVFVDDDVTVDPMWLQNLTAPFCHRDYCGVGGRILPQWSVEPPKWMSTRNRHFMAVLAILDLGREACPLQEPPFGANMAFRKEVFERYGFFRTDLGRRGRNLMSNCDVEFGRRLLKAGEKLWYEPSAIVHHTVSEQRLQPGYFLRWSYCKARSDIQEMGVQENDGVSVLGVPLHLCSRLAAWTIRWMVAITPSRRFYCKFAVWSLAGGIVESYRQRRTAAPAGQETSQTLNQF
jgi:glucosyl-dolichyl phosphate glucuronosyltransferase